MVQQAHRQIRVNTPLPTDALVFKSMSMREQLGRLFEMRLEFYSDDPNVDFDKVLGHPICVELDHQDGKTRYFDAYVTKFGFGGSHGRRYVYTATANPWLWFLTRTENCRIFHEHTVEDIVRKVFGENGMTDFEFRLTKAYPNYEYCVQYCETDFNFVSRMLEREGIYYFFEHDNGSHKMILTDAQSEHEPEDGYDQYEYFARDDFSAKRREGVFGWHPRRQVEATQVALQDYDFKKPAVDLGSDSSISRKHGFAEMEVYHYPGVYTELDDGTNYAKTRIEELQARHETVQADSNLRGVKTGRNFSLIMHPVQAFNTEYLVTGASYELIADDYESGGQETETFLCTFSAIKTEEVFRPARLSVKPRIPGPQTAVVVGKEGEEIDPDEHGRVWVHFHWEREGSPSLPVRVSQLWAGNGWGGMFIPRIGQEVIVEFEDGDPDRPIITGRVYNGVQKNPYDPPANRNISSIRTNSVKGKGFNELRFDDTAGEEEIFIRAQYNMETRVLHDAKRIVMNDEHEIIEQEERREIRAERHETVDHDVYVTHKDNQHLDIGTNFLIKTGADTVLTATGKIHLKSSNQVVIEAPSGITIKSGGSFVTVNPGGVHIQGPVVNVNSGGPSYSGPGTAPAQAKIPEEAKEQTGGKVDPRLSSVASALLAAAKSRKPFCAICNA